MRTELSTVEQVEGWVAKKGGKSCEWRISSVGAPSADDWNPYISASNLPIGKKLTLRVKGNKGDGVTVCLAHVAIMSSNECSKCGKDRSTWERELQTREQKLHEQKVEFVDYMQESNLALIQNKIGMKTLESKQQDASRKYYDIVFDVDKRLSDRASKEDELYARAQKAENYHEIGAQANWTINRVVNMYGLSKVKKFEDITPEWIERIQNYMLYEASVQHLKHLPHAAQRLALDATRLPADQFLVFVLEIFKCVPSDKLSGLMTGIAEWMQSQGM